MSIESVAASPASPPEGGSGVVEKPGNVSVGQVAAELLKRSQPTPVEAPGAEHATPAQAEATEITSAPAGESTTPTAEPVATGEAPKVEPIAPDPEDVLSTESNPLDPKLQAKIQARIAKEVAKREALRIENEVLKAQLIQAAAPKQEQKPNTSPTLEQPLAHVADVQSLLAEQTSAKEVKRWAEYNLRRDDLGDGVLLGDRKYSRSDLNDMVRNATVVLEDQVPQRYQFLQARQVAEQQALEAFPWMKDKSTPEYAAMQNAYQAYPWLRNIPDAPLVIGRQILGAQAFDKQQAEKKAGAVAAPAVRPKAPASQVAMGGQTGAIRQPASTQAAAKLQAAVEQMKQKGNVSRSDVAKILQAKELTRTR